MGNFSNEKNVTDGIFVAAIAIGGLLLSFFLKKEVDADRLEISNNQAEIQRNLDMWKNLTKKD